MNVRLVKIHDLTEEMIALDKELFAEVQQFMDECNSNPDWPHEPKQRRKRGPNKPKPPEMPPTEL
jgi:hypothetical protein